MGNLTGCYRKKGLALDKVAEVAAIVCEGVFPTTLAAELRGSALEFRWVHPEDRARWGDVAFTWQQQGRNRVGGKRIVGAGEVGYWMAARICGEVAARIPGALYWDESAGTSAPDRPDLWAWLKQPQAYLEEPDATEAIRLGARSAVGLGRVDRRPRGLPESTYAEIPAWALSPGQLDPTPSAP